ncbi:hypothetical protein [Thiothrix subterranea]|nr:hypothetical protein [Thiothrix subterranea]
MEHVNVWLSDHLLEIIVSAALALGLLIVGMWLLLARNGRETKELISVSNKS